MMNKYGKQKCMYMDWSNVKEIHNNEIAYRIHTHALDIYLVQRLDNHTNSATTQRYAKGSTKQANEGLNCVL